MSLTLTKAEIAAVASELLEAEEAGTQIPLISQRFPAMTLHDAYAIQTAQMEQKLSAGRTILGWKIGLTSKIMQDALGIDTPDSGVLYDTMLFHSGDQIPKGRFIQPRVEAEIAFMLKEDIDAKATRDDVLAATDYIVPALEILDTRVMRKDPATGEARKIFDTVADNAANAGIVVGHQHHQPQDFDLRWVGAIVRSGGDVVATGLGAAVLDDPVLSVQWLAQRMETYGQQIKAGQVVLSGSFIAPIECPPGTDICADFGPMGRVDLVFD